MTSAAPSRSPHRAVLTASARVAEIFERHGRMVYGICRAMLRDVPEAEDAVQQAFLSAHRALIGGAHVRDEAAWIATIARNECRSRISAAMRAPLTVPEEGLAEIVDGADDVERRMHARELGDALAQLPERQREAVILRYVCGLRYGEVAKALGLSRPATEALLFRARRAMRVRLRHATGAVIVVPLSVREELALALPGFEAHAGEGAATAGLVGGLLAKLASAPAAAKLATATVAVSAVGAVGAVESDRPAQDLRAESRLTAALPEEQVAAPRAGYEGREVSGAPGKHTSGFSGSREDGRRSGGKSSGGGDDASRGTSGRSESPSHDSDDGDPEPEDERDVEAKSSSGPGSDSRDDERGDDRGSGELLGTSGTAGPSVSGWLDDDHPEDHDEHEESDETSNDSDSGSGSDSGRGSDSDSDSESDSGSGSGPGSDDDPDDD